MKSSLCSSYSLYSDPGLEEPPSGQKGKASGWVQAVPHLPVQFPSNQLVSPGSRGKTQGRGKAQCCLWRENSPLFPVVGSGFGQRESIFPGSEQTTCQTRLRSSGPSWAAVGTLGQLSFHPHQSQPARRLSHIQIRPQHLAYFGLLGLTLSRELDQSQVCWPSLSRGAHSRRHRPPGWSPHVAS